MNGLEMIPAVTFRCWVLLQAEAPLKIVAFLYEIYCTVTS